MTCQKCGSKNHPGLKSSECPFDEGLLRTLDYNKVLSMLAKTEFQTNNPESIRIRMNFLNNLPSYGPKKKPKKSKFPEPDTIDDMDFEEIQSWCYSLGIEETTVLGMKKALKRKLNRKKTKQTPRGEIRMDFALSCSIEGHSEYEHVFHMKDLASTELQKKLGSSCGYTHGTGKKCLGKIVSRTIL